MQTEVRNMEFKDVVSKYGTYIGLGFASITAALFVLTPVWQLIIISGILGGIWMKRGKDGALVGALGVGAVWGLYIIIKSSISAVDVLIEQIAGIIIGDDGFGVVFMLIIVLVGAGIGALGGCIGFLIKNLFFRDYFHPAEMMDRDLV